MRARLLVRKLSFLKKVVEAMADVLVGGVVRAFSNRLATLCLARECRDLEEEMAGRILGRWEDGEAAAVGTRDTVCRCGRVWMVEGYKAKASLAAEAAQRVSWAKVWDASMDFGIGCRLW